MLSADLPWEALAGRTVLITGAAGFLPAYMVETLLLLNERRPEQKMRVLGLVRHEGRARERFAAYVGRDDLLVQDVPEPVTPGEKVDYIIHAASQASPKYYQTDPVGTLSANVFGTQHLLNLAREHGVQGFLFFSSGEVYGQITDAQVPPARPTAAWRIRWTSARVMGKASAWARRRASAGTPSTACPPPSPGRSTPTGRGCPWRMAASSPTSWPALSRGGTS